jgi:hypothetical protein
LTAAASGRRRGGQPELVRVYVIKAILLLWPPALPRRDG